MLPDGWARAYSVCGRLWKKLGGPSAHSAPSGRAAAYPTQARSAFFLGCRTKIDPSDHCAATASLHRVCGFAAQHHKDHSALCLHTIAVKAAKALRQAEASVKLLQPSVTSGSEWWSSLRCGPRFAVEKKTTLYLKYALLCGLWKKRPPSSKILSLRFWQFSSSLELESSIPLNS